MSKDPVVAHEPDYSLRKIIGKNVRLSDIFTKEKIEASQKMIEEAKDAFFDSAMAELQMVEEMLKTRTAGADKDFDALFEKIATHIINIKGFAEVFGYNFVTSICGYISEHCHSTERSPEVRFLLIGDLLKMLRLSIKQKITDQSGSIHKRLAEELG